VHQVGWRRAGYHSEPVPGTILPRACRAVQRAAR
jgi:hypothetical protein